MATIYLIRHGQKETHAGNPGLTQLGKMQAQQTGEYLQQFPITALYASPYQRTTETADQVSAVLGLPYATHQSLVERMNWEDDGTPKQTFLQEWVKATRERDYKPQWGDSSRAAGERVQQLVHKVALAEAQVVFISHGGAILDFLRTTFDDEPFIHLLKQYKVGEDYQMHNCSINKVVLDTPPALELLNYTGHLAELSE